MNEQMDISASQQKKYQLVIDVSTGKLTFEQIRDWLKRNSK
ncbi:MAG: hypothetical protein RIE86_25450 [Imperialibacter sp.]